MSSSRHRTLGIVFCLTVTAWLAVRAPALAASFDGRLTGSVRLQGINDPIPFREMTWIGTKGQSRGLWGFSLQFAQPADGLFLEYQCHLSELNDTVWMRAPSFCGILGRRLESFKIRLTGPRAAEYDVIYMCHQAEYGDHAPARNGEPCGDVALGRQIEAMNVTITRRSPFNISGIVHEAELGDVPFTSYQLAGEIHKSRALEALRMHFLPTPTDLGIEYGCFPQLTGQPEWHSDPSDNPVCGFRTPLGGLKVRLTKSQAAAFDVYYVCHVRDTGFVGPIKNGEFCQANALPVEALYIWVASKF